MKRALIFGVGGFVGRYLTNELRTHGYAVFGADLACDSPDFMDGFFLSNILDEKSVNEIIEQVKPTHIINLAAISSVGQSWKIPQLTVSINVIGTLNILEAAKKIETKPRVLLIGSSEEYCISSEPISENDSLDANNPYGISKIAQENFARVYREKSGMKIFCVRAFNHTGIGQRDTFVLPSFCKQVAEIEKSGKPGVISVGNLDVTRDFCDVRDIVKAYRLILESNDDSNVYNVGSGNGYSLRELLNYIISLSSQYISIQTNRDIFRPNDNPIICCDYSLIKKTLGWEPAIDIKDTLKEIYLYFLTNGDKQ